MIGKGGTAAASNSASEGAVRIELLVAPDCPHASAARSAVAECLDQLRLDVRVRERVGEYPSPTVLVDGVDVMTDGRDAPRRRACRLDLPTTSRIRAALLAELHDLDVVRVDDDSRIRAVYGGGSAGTPMSPAWC